MAFNFDCFFTIAFPSGSRLVWDLPTMKSDDLSDLRNLFTEVKLYNDWVDLLNNGKAPVSSYDSDKEQERRFLAGGWFEEEENHIFSLEGFTVGIILDDRTMPKAERSIIMRQFPELISLFHVDIDLEEASTEDDLVLYSILRDPLGEDFDYITLGYNVFPTTKKLIDQTFLHLKAERLKVKDGPMPIKAGPVIPSFLCGKRQRPTTEIFKMTDSEVANEKSKILSLFSGKEGVIRKGSMGSRLEDPRMGSKVDASKPRLTGESIQGILEMQRFNQYNRYIPGSNAGSRENLDDATKRCIYSQPPQPLAPQPCDDRWDSGHVRQVIDESWKKALGEMNAKIEAAKAEGYALLAPINRDEGAEMPTDEQ